jgi:hypothetical protein
MIYEGKFLCKTNMQTDRQKDRLVHPVHRQTKSHTLADIYMGCILYIMTYVDTGPQLGYIQSNRIV